MNGVETCYRCNSKNDPSCLDSPKTTETCKKETSKCFTFVLRDSVLRGCTDNEPPQVTQKYADKLLTCDKHANCNDQPITTERCYSLEHSTHDVGTLKFSPEHSQRCAYDVNRPGCYHAESKATSSVRKGCVSDLSADELNELQRTSTVSFCMGDNCNSRVKTLSCVSCESSIYSKDNARCLSTVANVLQKACTSYHDQCYTHLNLWEVKRGCLSDAPENVRADCAAQNGHCEVCDEPDGCNHKTHDYELCYSMEYSKDEPIPVSSKHVNRCYLKTAAEGCYHLEKPDGTVRKGCVSALTETERTNYLNKKSFKTCQGNLCNKKESFFSCYSCLSSDKDGRCVSNMTNVSLLDCDSYDDKCYTYSTDGIDFQRGCLSRAPPKVQHQCDASNRYCSVCDQPGGCNDDLRKSESCYSVAYKGNRAIELLPKQSKVCAFAMEPMGCYHLHDAKSGLIEKGCLADLSDREWGEYGQLGLNFKTCTGTNCNNKPEFMSCLKCETNVYGNTTRCVSELADAEHETCDLYDDQCFTYVDMWHVRRGCLSRAVQKVKDVCATGSGISECGTCAGSDCNDKVLTYEYCHSLVSKDSAPVKPSDKTLRRCQLWLQPNRGCYHFDNPSISEKIRGCSSDIRRDKLPQALAPYYKLCVGDGCNSRPKFPSCLTCKASGHKTNCALHVQNLKPKVCGNYLDTCFVASDEGSVFERGCLSEAITDLTGKCGPDDRNCRTCDNDDGCNSQQRQVEVCYAPHHLIQNNTKTCSYTIEPMGCYQYTDPKTHKLDRGCMSDLSDKQIETYSKQAPHFQACFGHKCNTARCLSCVSNGKDDTCLSDLSNVQVETCKLYDDACYTRISGPNTLERGCVSSLDEQALNNCKNGHNCTMCVHGSNCNNRPKELEKCVTFNGYPGGRVFVEKKTVACPLTWHTTGCYHFQDPKSGVVGKGCIADVHHSKWDKMANLEAALKTCTGNECNHGDSFQTCLSCMSNYHNDVCDSNFTKVEAKVCSEYGDKCYVHLNLMGLGVERGCLKEASNDVRQACEDNKNCETCDGTRACNNQKKEFEYCHAVTYKTDATVQDMPSKKCPKSIIQMGCYHYEDKNTAEKGCLSALSKAQLRAFLDKPDSFRRCKGKNCNVGRTLADIDDANKTAPPKTPPNPEDVPVGPPITPDPAGPASPPNPPNPPGPVSPANPPNPSNGPNGESDKDNTTLIVVLTLLGVAIVLGIGGFLYYRRNTISCFRN